MKNSMTDPESVSNDSTVQSSSLRKRAIVSLFIMPLFLATFGCLAWVLWQVSIKWVIASDSTTKLIWGITGVLIILLEIIIGHYARRFSNWVFPGKLYKRDIPNEDGNNNK